MLERNNRLVHAKEVSISWFLTIATMLPLVDLWNMKRWFVLHLHYVSFSFWSGTRMRISVLVHVEEGVQANINIQVSNTNQRKIVLFHFIGKIRKTMSLCEFTY